jgi:serine/threonine protein kinase
VSLCVNVLILTVFFLTLIIFNIVKSAVIGSVEYCAPEQSMGKPLFISDLYSLGVTYLHLLTGMSPFDLYSPMEGEWVWRDYLNGNLVSDELGKILEKLANPIAKHRYQSVKQVVILKNKNTAVPDIIKYRY